MKIGLYKDNAIFNVIEIEDDTVVLTQAEAEATPFVELVLGKFYILPEGATVGPVAELPFVGQTE